MQFFWYINPEFGEAIGIKCDVTQKNEIENVIKTAVDTFGRIDILFNNAGTNRPAKVVDLSDEAWETVLNTCLRGTFYSCRVVLPIMIKQKFGRIVNIASTAAFMGLDYGHAHYAAAKAGVMAFGFYPLSGHGNCAVLHNRKYHRSGFYFK